jgi:septal ring factor EnvC (AmiA/AmiB activator)
MWYKIDMSSLQRNKIKLEKGAEMATKWIGSTASLATHTALFVTAFSLPFLGIPFERMLLVLTTIVSLEAIYLSIFIQMSVNKNTQDIEIIQEDVEEIQEDVEEIEKDVDEIQEDVEGIEKDVDEIQKDVDEIQEDIEDIEEDDVEETKQEQQEQLMLLTIQETLKKLSKEIETLKK